MLDLAIIGGGPAALSAAIYAGRAGLKTTVFERASIGGELDQIHHISNYPGFEGSGQELAKILRRQVEQSGAKLSYGECTAITEVTSAEEDPEFQLTIDDETIKARAVLFATGSEPRPLGFELEVPVSYCALCDADLARNRDIAVVGGGNSAVQEALQLAPLVKTLTLISHSPLKAEPYLQTKLQAQSNVKLRVNLEPTPDLLNQFERVFVFIGKRPATQCIAKLASTVSNFFDPSGYIEGDHDGFIHQTAIRGIFVAGDVRAHVIRQVVTAVGDGAAAAVEIAQFLRH